MEEDEDAAALERQVNALIVSDDTSNNVDTMLADVETSRKSATLSSSEMRRMMCGTPTAVKAILRKLGRGFPFHEIRLSSRQLGDDDVLSVCEALRINDTVQYLYLDYNRSIGPTSGEHIANLLTFNVALTHLDLASAAIGPKGAMALGKVMELNESLTELKLEGNNIEDKGAICLANGLKKNDSLQKLHLWSNGIGVKGGRAFAGLLSNKRSFVTMLSLGGNPIKNTRDGANVLEEIERYLVRNRRQRVEDVMDLVRELTDFFYDVVQVIDGYLHAEQTY